MTARVEIKDPALWAPGSPSLYALHLAVAGESGEPAALVGPRERVDRVRHPDRAADHDAMSTARQILERGDAVLIFPEGTRTRPGTLGAPKRGVGRLALETGAPVIPVAVIGTENIRRGWRIRPHKVAIRAGAPLRFPMVDQPSPQLAQAVTERQTPERQTAGGFLSRLLDSF